MTNIIYRDMAYQELTEYIEGLNECTNNINPVSLLMGVQGIIRTMPSAKQEKGQWVKMIVRGSPALYCSCCDQDSGVLYSYNYCPNCGAEMEGVAK